MTTSDEHLMAANPADASLESLQEWVGRAATMEDVIQSSSAQRLFATLDRENGLSKSY
jgi:hypothetical protein